MEHVGKVPVDLIDGKMMASQLPGDFRHIRHNTIESGLNDYEVFGLFYLPI